MKIVVLDGYTLNPGDLNWDALEKIADCEIHDKTEPEDVVARAAGAEVVLTNKTVLSKEIIDQLSDLKYIGVLATGYNVVDVEAAKAKGIPVCNIPIYGTKSVAQMVFAHLLNLTQHVDHHAATVNEGRWTTSPHFCYWDYPLIELEGLTMGIVGFGRIGQATAELALAFGMKVIAHDEFVKDPAVKAEMVSVEEIFGQSDVISLHCPLTPDTENIVNAERLAMMKKTAFIINTSRGPLIDEKALADALNNERIAGAGVDVLSVEPAKADNPLLGVKNCYVTPHIAWATKSARARLMGTAVENVQAYLDGSPQNVVNL
ncbi:MAG: D-2-hydroxyacid dehydrogenase [Planctomycetota bacterium]|jgi:glycerate dehydrogenase